METWKTGGGARQPQPRALRASPRRTSWKPLFCGRPGIQWDRRDALGFTTFYSLSGGIAVEHGLEFGPATPENKPTRSVIALTVLMTAETRQRIKKVMDCQILARTPRRSWLGRFSHGYAVFTHDLDFGTALAPTHAGGPSVIQVRGQRVLPEHMGPVVLAALKQYEAELSAAALVVVEHTKNRVRVLPL